MLVWSKRAPRLRTPSRRTRRLGGRSRREKNDRPNHLLAIAPAFMLRCGLTGGGFHVDSSCRLPFRPARITRRGHGGAGAAMERRLHANRSFGNRAGSGDEQRIDRLMMKRMGRRGTA
jgi:hypothetical protein